MAVFGISSPFSIGWAAEPAVAAGDDEISTVSVFGQREQSYRATSAAIGGFGEAPLRDTPVSISVIDRALLDDQQARLLSDVIRNDASVGENYAPEGYYQDIAIRGFPLDLATGLKINGLAVAGEQNVALENKERVEILKGLSGLQGGVATPGGLVNYVTKRPADILAGGFAVDDRGGTLETVDGGAIFGAAQQYGLRLNAAREDIHSYVDHADGFRNFISLAGDWQITPEAKWMLDADYQLRRQRSVSGYQLLGGTTVPTDLSPSKMLGSQAWVDPVTTNSVNVDSRFDYDFNADWKVSLAAAFSQTVIDDNVAFAYGCYYVSSCGAGGTPPYYFAANGDFDVYDWRSPDDTRRDLEVRPFLQGKFATAGIRHDITLGASFFRRTVDQTTAVYDYIGTDNIYNPVPIAYPRSPSEPGDSFLRLDSRQYSGFLSDRVQLSEQWQLVVGGRAVRLLESAFDTPGVASRKTAETVLLPQYAVIYKPIRPLSLYASYTEGLSLGEQAPAWASNAYAFLQPYRSTQYEVGAKYDWGGSFSLTGALFQIEKPFDYARPDGSEAGVSFVQQGQETHRGVEFGATGRLTPDLDVNLSATAMQARPDNSGTPAYDGRQAINVPDFRSAVTLDYAVSRSQGVDLLGGWTYVAAKPATRDDAVYVPDYHLLNAGLRYAPPKFAGGLVFRLTVDNLLDKRYWKDVGQSAGDSYLHLGAPRTARFSVQYKF